MQTRRIVLLGLAVIVLVAALLLLPWSAGSIGKGDFIGYWSSSRLLLQGNDPYGLPALRDLQYQTYPERGYLIYTWNPPWLPVMLLPLAYLPFAAATRIWMLANLGIMIGAGLLVWLGMTGDRSGRAVLLTAVATVFFPPSLAAIGAGQIVPWVFLASVAIVIWQLRNQHLVLAGALLPVMLLKPQVTFLVAVLSVWCGLRRRQWSFFIAGSVSVMFLLVIATLLYPEWPQSYLGNITGRDVALWLTPTLGGMLFAVWPVSWIRYVGLFLALAVPVFYEQFQRRSMWLLLGLTLASGIALAPFGWSFDQIVLLPLILYLLAVPFKRWWLYAGLLALYAVPLLMRIAQVDEFNYFWISWLVLALYLGVERSGGRLSQPFGPSPESEL